MYKFLRYLSCIWSVFSQPLVKLSVHTNITSSGFWALDCFGYLSFPTEEIRLFYQRLLRCNICINWFFLHFCSCSSLFFVQAIVKVIVIGFEDVLFLILFLNFLFNLKVSYLSLSYVFILAREFTLLNLFRWRKGLLWCNSCVNHRVWPGCGLKFKRSEVWGFLYESLFNLSKLLLHKCEFHTLL